MNVEAPRLLKTCRGELDALGAAIRDAVDNHKRSVPRELKALLNRLDGRRGR